LFSKIDREKKADESSKETGDLDLMVEVTKFMLVIGLSAFVFSINCSKSFLRLVYTEQYATEVKFYSLTL